MQMYFMPIACFEMLPIGSFISFSTNWHCLVFASSDSQFLPSSDFPWLFPSFCNLCFSARPCSLHPPPSRLQMFGSASRCYVFITLDHILTQKLSSRKHLQRRLLSSAASACMKRQDWRPMQSRERRRARGDRGRL